MVWRSSCPYLWKLKCYLKWTINHWLPLPDWVCPALCLEQRWFLTAEMWFVYLMQTWWRGVNSRHILEHLMKVPQYMSLKKYPTILIEIWIIIPVMIPRWKPVWSHYHKNSILLASLTHSEKQLLIIKWISSKTAAKWFIRSWRKFVEKDRWRLLRDGTRDRLEIPSE